MKRKKIVFQKLLNRNIPYSTPEVFEIFRWMIRTGWSFRPKYGAGVFECLYDLSSINAQDYWYTYGFSSFNFGKRMQTAFVRAIVSEDFTGGYITQWRKAERIRLDGYRMLPVDCDWDYWQLKDSLCYIFHPPKLLRVSLNKYHEDAREIYGVGLTTKGDQWRADLIFGCQNSSWTHILAHQKNRTFPEFVIQAARELKRLAE